MKNDTIKQLKIIRAGLMQQVEALDSAISILERMGVDSPENDTTSTSAEERSFIGRAGSTTFESAIDFRQPEPLSPWTCPKCGTFNPAGANSCTECKTKRPKNDREQ